MFSIGMIAKNMLFNIYLDVVWKIINFLNVFLCIYLLDLKKMYNFVTEIVCLCEPRFMIWVAKVHIYSVLERNYKQFIINFI